MKKLRKWISLITVISLALGVFSGTVTSVQAAPESDSASKNNTIALAYDDSSSMMNNENNIFVDRWCQAKYALEVFSTMMLDSDEMTVYPLNNVSDKFTVSGSDSQEKRKSQVEQFEIGCVDSTPYGSVETAFNDLVKKGSGTNRWLVILTDGSFNSVSYTQLNTNFKKYAEQGINVVYLRIFDGNTEDAGKVTHLPDQGIYVYEAMKSKDTLNKITEISNLIFKRQALSSYDGVIKKNSDSLTLTLDVPVSQLIVFAQGDNIEVGKLTGEDGTEIPRNSAIEVDTPEIPKDTGSYSKSDIVISDGLGGVVAAYANSDGQAFPTGTYTLKISDTTNVEVYCKLAVNVELELVQDSQIAEDDGNIFMGDYSARIKLTNPITGEELDGTQKLLSDMSYDINVVNEFTDSNGNAQSYDNHFDQSSFEGSLERGSATISGKIKIGDSYTDFSKSLKVIEKLNPLEIYCDIPSDGYNLEEIEDALSGIDVMIMEAGELISDEHAEQLKLEVTTDKNVVFELEEGTEPGHWTIYPKLNGSIEETDQGDIPFTVSAVLNIDGQEQTADITAAVNLYVNTVPLDITINVPEDDYPIAINAIPQLNKGGAPEDAEAEEDFPYIMAECRLDGKLFTEEEWESAEVSVGIYDEETGSVVESDELDFAVKFIKGTGDNVSKVLIIPCTRISNLHKFLSSQDVQFQVKVSYNRLGVICKGNAIGMFTVDNIGIVGLLIYWVPIIAVIIFIVLMILGMTVFKNWNKPHPLVERREWTWQDGEKVNDSHCIVGIASYASLLPFRNVVWMINPNYPGTCPVILQATSKTSYKIENLAELEKHNVQKNGVKITADSKIPVPNSSSFTYVSIDTKKRTLKYKMYIHKKK